MRFSFVFLTISVSLASTAYAASSSASASVQPAAGTVPTAAPAATDKVYPPLPTLAMLPPPTSDDDDEAAPATRHTAKHGKKSRHPECHCTAPSPHLVVSDESRAYLQDVERQLDVALAR
ncbi:hypothetical protein [Paraburkholderia acidipaludis]|uniref:hypothetical protein n=1 Tax=Paraburkholderia acidipaludis TaxID=660537 RepID=UPI000486BE01